MQQGNIVETLRQLEGMPVSEICNVTDPGLTLHLRTDRSGTPFRYIRSHRITPRRRQCAPVPRQPKRRIPDDTRGHKLDTLRDPDVGPLGSIVVEAIQHRRGW